MRTILSAVESVRLNTCSGTEQIRSVAARLDRFVAEHVVGEYQFTKASSNAVKSLLQSLQIEQISFSLPSSLHLPLHVAPFVWGLQGEKDAADALLTKLRVCVLALQPSVAEHHFMDVQSLATTTPLRITQGETAVFSGAPDVVILRERLDPRETVVPLSSCVVSIDWKTPTAMAQHFSIARIAAQQAIGFSRLHADGFSPPVFFTDLSTCFRCWLLIGHSLCVFKGAAGADLSLKEGVALIHYFLKNEGRLAAADVPAGVVGLGDRGAWRGSGRGDSGGDTPHGEEGGGLSPGDGGGGFGGGGTSGGGAALTSFAASLLDVSSPAMVTGPPTLVDSSPEEVARILCRAGSPAGTDDSRWWGADAPTPPPEKSREEHLTDHFDEWRACMHAAAVQLRAAGVADLPDAGV